MTITTLERDAQAYAIDRWTPARLGTQYDPKFVAYRHSVLMANQFRRMVTGIEPWQIWTWQPQIGKSEIAMRKGPIWVHDWYPDKKIILASYAVSLAMKSSRYVRNTYRDRTDILRVRLDPTRTAQSEFFTTEGGSILAVGVGGSITGNPADILLMDDLHKNWFEAHQIGQRDRVWDWILGDAFNRLQDDSCGLLCSTRWHPDDATGRMEDHGIAPNGEPWTHMHVPAIADSGITPNGDPLGRADGEIVEPRRFRKTTMLQRRKLAGPIIWNAEYQGIPRLIEGGIIRRSWFGTRDSMPRVTDALTFITSWDCTFSDTSDGSYVVGQAWAMTADTPHRFVLYDQVRARWDYPATRHAFLEFARRHPECKNHLIEKAANGPALAAEVIAMGLEGIHTVPVSIDKTSRAIRISPLVADGRVLFPAWKDDPWIGEVLDEVADFPGGTHDDQVDALTQALYWLDRYAGARFGREVTVIDERLFGRR